MNKKHEVEEKKN